jgi:energy coupling factor transporter S component ThiW
MRRHTKFFTGRGETAKMNNESVNTKKLALTAIFAAVAVVGSMFSFPIFGSKCAPVQHLVNVLCAVFLGPGWGLAAALIASVIRNLTGLGTLLAFPGSMCGALLSGLLYKRFKTLPAAWIGEVFGTAVIGGILAYPVASLIMGNTSATLFIFVVPFLISTVGGTIIAAVITQALQSRGVIGRLREEIE